MRFIAIGCSNSNRPAARSSFSRVIRWRRETPKVRSSQRGVACGGKAPLFQSAIPRKPRYQPTAATLKPQRMTATEMDKLLKSGDTVGTIDLVVKVPSIVFSITRDTYWAQKYGLKVVGPASNPSDDIAGGEKAMTQLLGQHSNLKGVMAYNDPSAVGAGSM